MTFANFEQAQFWSQLAPVWLELEDRLEQVIGSPGQVAMDRLGVRPGQRVVDLGCGPGRTTLQLASLVAPDGMALGVDISLEMLVRARERAASLDIGNLEFLHADIQVQDLGEAAFDAAYSRFGVMFFKDPVVAFTNVRRALRSGARLSFVCWQSVFDNEWMLIPRAAAMSVMHSLPPMPEAGDPGPFFLADPDRVRSVLGAAGFDHVEVVRHNDSIRFPEDAIPDVALTSMRTGAVRDALESADEETGNRVRLAIEEVLRDRLEGGEVTVSRGVFVVLGEAL